MKKQIIAAAVAATMTSVALADISITGSTKVNYTATEYDSAAVANTNAVATEHDIKIVGKNGDTSYTVSLEMDDAEDNGIDVEDNYITTKVGDFSIKAGDWDNGNNFLRESSRTNNSAEISTNVGPAKVTWWSGHGTADDKYTLSTDVAGASVKFVTQAKDQEYVVSGNVAGIGATVHMDANDTANTDKRSVELTGNLGGMGVKFVDVDTDTGAYFGGDMWYGDWEQVYSGAAGTANAQGTKTGLWYAQKGMDIRAVELSTAVAGNDVKFRHIAVDKDTATVDANDRTINRVIVTRPLAGGTTLEVMYTDAEETGDTAASYSQLDVELSVKF